jgi:hypothetical protein
LPAAPVTATRMGVVLMILLRGCSVKTLSGWEA